MAVKMLVGIACDEFSCIPGETTDKFDAETEKRLIESGQAEPVSKPKASKKTSKK